MFEMQVRTLLFKVSYVIKLTGENYYHTSMNFWRLIIYKSYTWIYTHEHFIVHNFRVGIDFSVCMCVMPILHVRIIWACKHACYLVQPVYFIQNAQNRRGKQHMETCRVFEDMSVTSMGETTTCDCQKNIYAKKKTKKKMWKK